MKASTADQLSILVLTLMLLTYLFLDSRPPLVGAVGAADDSWGVVVMLLLHLLLVRTHPDSRSSPVRLVTAGGFLHH